jgi:hypothetical protein
VNTFSALLRIVDGQGKLIDEIAVAGEAYSSIFDPTVTQRLMNAARMAGRYFGKYLEKRIQGG